MDRRIVYLGENVLETDLLSTNRQAMIALGYALQATLGTGTIADGLACTATMPASLSVNVGPGSIMSVGNIDATAYSTLAADTRNIVKQGLSLDTINFALTAPPTTGQSVVYLIEAAYQDVDTDSVTLPYYNASNPNQSYSGPSNSGTAQYTTRKGKCLLQVKTGTAATTGSQATPTPDAGFTALYAVTVANGQTTITSGNIAVVGSPFVGTKLTGKADVSSLGALAYLGLGSYLQNTGGNVGVLPDYLAHGQCKLVLSSSNLVLKPYNGNKLRINAAPQTIPSAGVTLAPTGLAASTTYFIYAYMNAGVMTLEASATGHSTDTTNGVEIKTGDATRTLVGQARTTASVQFIDYANQRFLRTWFNDAGIFIMAMMPGSPNQVGVTAAAWAELTSTARAEFLTWANETLVGTLFSGNCSVYTAGNVINLGLGLDSTTAATGGGCRMTPANAAAQCMANGIRIDSVSEGYHYATPLGGANGSVTAYFNHSLSPFDVNLPGTGAVLTARRMTLS